MADADRIVLPGVGAFADCGAGLDAVAGMAEALRHAVLAKGRPFFGICVGMQLMASRGLEHGSHQGFDWIAGDVAPIEPLDSRLKIPHMGWNDLEIMADHPVLAGLRDGDATAKEALTTAIRDQKFHIVLAERRRDWKTAYWEALSLMQMIPDKTSDTYQHAAKRVKRYAKQK